MIKQYYFLLLVFGVLLLASSASAAAGPVIKNVVNLPDFITNSKGQGRDSGRSAPLGNGKLLWVFDDTFTPSGLLSASGAWADISKPNVLTEEVDSKGSPFQFYPFTFYELLYNNQQESKADPCCQNRKNCTDPKNAYCNCKAGTDCHQRIAFWNERPFAINSTTILLIYRGLKIGYAGNFDNIGMGIAYSNYPHTIANRVMQAPNYGLYIFGADEPQWDSLVMAGGFIYFTTGTTTFCTTTLNMARVPVNKITDKSAYTYYDGKGGFVSNLQDTKPIGVFGGGLGSAMWSTHLNAYLAFSLGICTGGTHGYFRTAPNPWGPWSDLTSVDFAPNGALSSSYAGELHPDLSSGNDVVVSYFVPAPGFSGMIHTRKVTLA